MKSDGGPITTNGIHPSTHQHKVTEKKPAAPTTTTTTATTKTPDEGKGNLFYPKQLGLRGAPKT